MSKKPKIMIVDDSETIRLSATNFLEPMYEVISVADGFLALGKIVEAQPDVLFMDIMMPRLDGYSACLPSKATPISIHSQS